MIYKNIAKIIHQKELINDQSLLHGNTGLSVLFYHLAKKTGLSEYQKTADDLIEVVFKNLNSSSPSDFESGMAGIGWGVEYLIQNNFVEGDSDDILEEVDNKVFKVLNEESINSLEVSNGLTGYLLYLISRLKNKSPYSSMPQQINRELLILTINRIYENLTTQLPFIVKDISFDLLWRYPMIINGLGEAFKLNIHNEKISCMMKQWTTSFESYIPSMQIYRLYLAVALIRIHSQIPLARLEKQIQILLFSTDFNILKTEINPGLMIVRFGWPGFVIVLQAALKLFPSSYPNYLEIKSTYEFICDKYLNTLNDLKVSPLTPRAKQLGISEGIAGLGLFSLFMPDLFQKSKVKG